MNTCLSQLVFIPVSEVYKNAVEVFQKATEGQPIIVMKNSQPLGAIISISDLHGNKKGN